MRIDPKFFNLFIGICAVITVIVIIISTFRYFRQQSTNFENNAAGMQADTLSFRSFLQVDSLFVSEMSDQPIIVQFWATWSGKSKAVNDFLSTYKDEHSNLMVIAAGVRDSDTKINEYMNEDEKDFHFVDGTDLYYTLMVPGVPSQIFIDEERHIVDTHIGDEIEMIQEKLDKFFQNE